jgi:hypothetical protein
MGYFLLLSWLSAQTVTFKGSPGLLRQANKKFELQADLLFTDPASRGSFSMQGDE